MTGLLASSESVAPGLDTDKEIPALSCRRG
jgi:hypothetical protein